MPEVTVCSKGRSANKGGNDIGSGGAGGSVSCVKAFGNVFFISMA